MLIRLLLLSIVSFELLAAQQLEFEGKALDLQTGVLLYKEVHQVIMDDKDNYVSAYVSYLDPEDNQFADKVLDYTKSQTMPEMLFHDKRNDDRIRVSTIEDSQTVSVLLEHKLDRNESTIDMPKNGVIDAGFDRFIIGNWSPLSTSKSLGFNFLAITRSRFYEFEFDQPILDGEIMSLVLRPSNFFLNMLVEPLLFEYDVNSKRLKTFKGLTNIQRFEDGKATGENFEAVIRYEYQDSKPYYLKPVISPLHQNSEIEAVALD